MIEFKPVMEFIAGYLRYYNMFKNRKYKKIFPDRPEVGPFTHRLDENNRPSNVGKNMVGDWFTDTFNFLTTWNDESFWKIFATQVTYYVMPIIGGYLRAKAYNDYT